MDYEEKNKRNEKKPREKRKKKRTQHMLLFLFRLCRLKANPACKHANTNNKYNLQTY